jgi:alpha-tubulin suppressor-like RCC1 family protein
MYALMTVACGQPEEGLLGTDEQSVPETGTLSAALMATASYDTTLRVPACSPAAEGCDSGTLVNGRGPVGPELNAPNNLGGSCADGTSGTYHVDESIDRVRLYTTDGSVLAPGKQVTLEVTVWAYSAYSSDYLDLYYTNSVDSPYWSHIATLVPQGAGTQTLRATFTLSGSTSPMQAVRAAFRYGGAAGTCVTGVYNDRDDLAFSVAAPPAPLASRKPRLVAAGSSFSLAVRAYGKVWAWGSNAYGQLGAGIYDTERTTPVQVVGLTAVKAVAAGDNHALALHEDGTVWSWGRNSHGQLGDGTTTDRRTPIQVPGLKGIIAVSAGAFHSLALRNDGTLWAWGHNGYGQLGDGTTTNRFTPVKVKTLAMWSPEFVVAIDAGAYHSMALSSEHTVWNWGHNGGGQLGDGSMIDRPNPTPVTSLLGVHAVSAGRNHSVALLQDGSVYVWGVGQEGQLGNNTWTVFQTSPVKAWLSSVVEIEAGGFHNLARSGDGKVWTWGFNYRGQLGDGTTTNKAIPLTTSTPVGKVLAGGDTHSMLYTATDELVFNWGGNYSGQLGIGSNQDYYWPTAAHVPYY